MGRLARWASSYLCSYGGDSSEVAVSGTGEDVWAAGQGWESGAVGIVVALHMRVAINNISLGSQAGVACHPHTSRGTK